MTGTDELDRDLGRWMAAEAAVPPPAGRLKAAVDAATAGRPLPRWRARFGADWFGADWLGGDADGTVVSRSPSRPRASRSILVVVLILGLVTVIAAGLVTVGGTPRPLLEAPPTAPSTAAVIGIASPSGSPASSAVPTPPPMRLGQLAYSLDGSIYLADWDGSHARRIAARAPGAKGPHDCGDYWAEGPLWAPDGRHLAYRGAINERSTCLETVNIANADGTLVATVLGGGWLIPWSPDSTRVLTQSPAATSTDIYRFDGQLVNSISLAEIKLLPGDFDPRWGFDGSTILEPCGCDYEYRLDGTPVAVPLPVTDWSSRVTFIYPALSPDGTTVASLSPLTLTTRGTAPSWWRAASAPTPADGQVRVLTDAGSRARPGRRMAFGSLSPRTPVTGSPPRRGRSMSPAGSSRHSRSTAAPTATRCSCIRPPATACSSGGTTRTAVTRRCGASTPTGPASG